MIEIQQRTLRSLEEDLAFRVEQGVHVMRRVAEQRPQRLACLENALDHGVDVELDAGIE